MEGYYSKIKSCGSHMENERNQLSETKRPTDIFCKLNLLSGLSENTHNWVVNLELLEISIS